jgi:hypothetical protein
VTSASDPQATGTRTESPLNLSFKFFNELVTARAALVVVGMIFKFAFLPLKKSLLALSTRF